MRAGTPILSMLACCAIAGAACAGPEGTVDPERVSGVHRVEVEGAWSRLSVMTVVDPLDFGAVGNGLDDDTEAVRAAIDAVPDGGGIVWFEPDTRYRTSEVIRITGDHLKLWTPNGGAELFAATGGRDGVQALIIDNAHGVGLFGLRISSDVDRRRTTLEDSAVVIDGASATEIVGLQITNSSSAAVMVFGGSTDTLVNGNYIHDTWADSVHFTDGADGAWVWGNIFATSAPTAGDDDVACVTYGSGPRCRNMEWWHNLHLGGEWGRGLAVVGGEDIDIHDNVVCRTAAAGILVASEPSYGTPGSERIRIVDNVIVGAGHVIPHSGILLSGLNGRVSDIVVRDNVVTETAFGQPFRVEGDVDDIEHDGTSDERPGHTVCPLRAEADPNPKDTSILATRDASFVEERHRRGLYRILVRRNPDGDGFDQRFEYVAAGLGPDSGELGPHADVVVEPFDGPEDPDTTGGSSRILLIHSARPLTLPAGLEAVTFEDLRRLARDRPELWARLDVR